jgi:uncharacterized protein YgfB (UPF0149 family)
VANSWSTTELQDSSAPPESLDYATLDTELRRAKASVGASEAHGIICGVLCVARSDETDWLAEIVPTDTEEVDCVDDLKRLLLELARDSRRLLETDGFDFYPLLPADEYPLRSRSEALSQWCSGFLFGLTLAGAGDLERLPAESREIVTDLANFTTIRGGAVDEEEEQAYAELVEYIRVGAMLIKQELNGWSSRAQAPHQLH